MGEVSTIGVDIAKSVFQIQSATRTQNFAPAIMIMTRLIVP